MPCAFVIRPFGPKKDSAGAPADENEPSARSSVREPPLREDLACVKSK